MLLFRNKALLSKKVLLGTVAIGTLTALHAQAADLAVKAPIVKASPEISPWSFEFGSRYWFSSGKYKKDLFAPGGSPQLSRLTYDDLTGHSAEAFWRVDHASGLFLKGYVGGGSIIGGKLNDEDFPPATSPYSNTLSDQKHGALGYVSVDLGYNFWTAPTWQLGGFVGYNYWNERVNTFGCNQIAGNAGICGSIPPAFGPVPASTNVLDNDATWNSLRVGLSGQVMLMPGWKLTGDVAYIHGWLDATDLHNLRPDIRGLPEDATGNGVQIDAMLTYQVSDAFSVGLGGRWWHIEGDGTSHFDEKIKGAPAEPIRIEQDRFGLLAQANYKFGETAPTGGYYKAPAMVVPAYHWTGLYAGVNAGYGINSDDVNLTPASANAATAIAVGDSPASESVRDAGFLAGGQIGYNWQTGGTVWGIETDLDWAQISGSTATTSTLDFFTTTVDKNLSWLGTTRARVGTLARNNLLLYVTGGVAYGGTELAFDQRIAGVNCPFNFTCSTGSVSKTKVGWTVGTGLEWAVTNRATFKAEYLFVDLGSTSLTSTDTATAGLAPFIYGVSTKFQDNIVRLGLNYKLY
jgi:opacity protein-like surface antigen